MPSSIRPAFLLSTVALLLSSLLTATALPTRPPAFPIDEPGALVAPQQPQQPPHEIAGHKRWRRDLEVRQAMANPNAVVAAGIGRAANAKATAAAPVNTPANAASAPVAVETVVTPVVAVPISTSPIAPTATPAAATAGTTRSTLPAASRSSAANRAIASSADSSVSSPTNATPSTSSSTSHSSSSASASSSPSSSETPSATSTQQPLSSSSSEVSQADPSQTSASPAQASSGNIFAKSNKLFAVGIVVIIAIVITGLLAVIYVIKRISHLPRYADARDYPRAGGQSAYGAILPQMRSSSQLERKRSDASDSSEKGLLPSRASERTSQADKSAADSAASLRDVPVPARAASSRRAATATKPAPAWATFSGPTQLVTSPTGPAAEVVTVPPRAATPVSSRTAISTTTPVYQPESATTAATLDETAARADDRPPAASEAVGVGSRWKWSPPEGRGSGLRFEV
ncbi:hypothetical protein JCM3774_000570 [Rhodotorula dairenensis]